MPAEGSNLADLYLHPPLVGLLVVTVLMVGLWAWHIRLQDAGIVDVGWTICLGLLAILYGILGHAAPWRRMLIAGLVGLWAARLSFHLLRDRVVGKPEDGRYRAMRASLGQHFALFMLPFFLLQGVLAVLLSAPFLLVAMDPHEAVRANDVLAVLLFFVGFLGVTVADRQLATWRHDPAHRGRTCRNGLWRYSRHPNYFFEWVLWCGYAVLALPAPHGWIAVSAPLILLLLVTKVTGIPYTELQAVKSRGDDYRRYQATTNAFFPWFPRAPDGTSGREGSGPVPDTDGTRTPSP